jgi:hypothetical protein
MKKIDKDELYGHVREFLKGKGVELQDGSYTQRIQQGCHLLARTINTSRDALQRAKAEADRRLDKVRQAIHEKTAPKPTAASPPPKYKPATTRTRSATSPVAAPSAAKATPRKPKPRASR